jgi:hypothetical protein
MAALICPRGHDDPGHGALCVHCGEYLRKAPAPEAAAGPARESPHGSRSAPSAAETCPESACGLELDGDRCPLHGIIVPAASQRSGGTDPESTGPPGGPDAQGLAVVFPWGSYALGPEPLLVGRSTTAPGGLAERMLEHGRWTGTDYGNVSRSHAVVWSDTQGAWIRHLSTTNETLLNGHVLPRDRARRLRVGDVLAFSKSLRAHVAAT